MAQLIYKRNNVGYSPRSQTDFSLLQVECVNYGLKTLQYCGPKHGIFFLVILKTLEHFENSQKNIKNGFLKTVLVESMKITYAEYGLGFINIDGSYKKINTYIK